MTRRRPLVWWTIGWCLVASTEIHHGGAASILNLLGWTLVSASWEAVTNTIHPCIWLVERVRRRKRATEWRVREVKKS